MKKRVRRKKRTSRRAETLSDSSSASISAVSFGSPTEFGVNAVDEEDVDDGGIGVDR